MDNYVELTGSRIKSRSVDPMTSSLSLGQLWQKSIISPFIGLDADFNYQFTGATITVDGETLTGGDIPETMAHSVLYPKVQFGFWWEESLSSQIITTFFTGVTTFLPKWNFINNQSGDYIPGMPVSISYPEVSEEAYSTKLAMPGHMTGDTIAQDYICHKNPAFNLTLGGLIKTTGDVPGFKIDPRWELCGNNYINYNYGSWYETLNPDGLGNFTNSTDHLNGDKRFTAGKKFRVKVGQFDLWGSSSSEDWSLDEAYIIVKVKEFDDASQDHLDPSGDSGDRKMPFALSQSFADSGGTFNESALGDNQAFSSGLIPPFMSLPLDVDCWECMNNYVVQSPPFFFTSMSVPFSSLISAHYKTNFDVFAYNFAEDPSLSPHFSDRYLKEENITTPFVNQGDAQNPNWVNGGYQRDPEKYTYSIIPNPLMSEMQIDTHSNEGVEQEGEVLPSLPQAMDTDQYNLYAYYQETNPSGEAVAKFDEPKFLINEGYLGDLGNDPVYNDTSNKPKFEKRLVDYVKSPFYWNRVFSSASNSIRSLVGKMSPALIFTEAEYLDIYSVDPPTRQSESTGVNPQTLNDWSDTTAYLATSRVRHQDKAWEAASDTEAGEAPGQNSSWVNITWIQGQKIAWPPYNEYNFNSFDESVLSHPSPETRTANTLIGEFLVRTKISSGFNWSKAAEQNVYTWESKDAGSNNSGTAKYVPAHDLIDFHRINSSEIKSLIAPQISLKTVGATENAQPQEDATAEAIPNSLDEILTAKMSVWHKGVKIPIYARILDYPYTRTGTKSDNSTYTYPGLGSTYETQESFSIFLSALLGYTASYDQGSGAAGNSKPIDHYQGWSTPPPNTIQQHAGQMDTNLSDEGDSGSASAPFGVHNEVDDGACFYDASELQASLEQADTNILYDTKYREVLGKNQGALWRFPEAVSSAINFGGKNELFHKIGYVQFPKTPNVGEGYVKEIAMLAVKNDTTELLNINASLRDDHVVGHLMADTGQVHEMTGGMLKSVDILSGCLDNEAGETKEHQNQAQYNKQGNNNIQWYNKNVASGITCTSDEESAFYEETGMYGFSVPNANYSSWPSTITQQQYSALSTTPDVSDLDEDDKWLATVANRTMYTLHQDSSAYNPNSFSATNHISDDDIAGVFDHSRAVASGISTKLGEYSTNAAMTSIRLKVIDQPYFFAQQKNLGNLFGNYKHKTDLAGNPDSSGIGRFYFYVNHNANYSYPAMKVGIPALLERSVNIPGSPTISTQSQTYVPPRANYGNQNSAANKNFIRSINLRKAEEGVGDQMGLNAVDGQDRTITINDTVADGAGIKLIEGRCLISNPPSISSAIPNRKNSTSSSYMVFYNNDPYDNMVSFNFPFNSPNSGHSSGNITVGGATGLSTDVSSLNLSIGIQTDDLTGGDVIFTLRDNLYLEIPDEASGSEYTKNVSSRIFKSMGVITLDTSSLQIAQFENYKNGILWVYKDKTITYSGAQANNPAVLNSTFGSIWADASSLEVYHDAVLKDTYDLEVASYSTSGWVDFDMNKDWFLGSSSWSCAVKFDFSDGTNLPTPFARKDSELQARGIKSPTITNFSSSNVVPSGYKLFIGALTNYVQEPVINIEFDLTVYSDLLATDSTDSHFYNHGFFELLFTDDTGTDYSKSISKDQYKTPRSASATGTEKTHSLSYSLSQINPTAPTPVSLKVLVSDEILELKYSTSSWDWGTSVNNNESLIEAIYQRVLGRESDTAGMAVWKASPHSALRLVDIFMDSVEYQNNLIAETALPDPRTDDLGDQFHASQEAAVTGLELDGNYTATKFSSDIVGTWEFRDIDGHYRSFNRASNWSNVPSTAYVSEKSLLLGTGSTVFKYGNEHFECASDALISRQRVFYASLCVMAIMNTSTNKALRINPETPARFTSLQNLGVDRETLVPFSLAGIAGSANVNKDDNVNGMEEYNFWSLDGVFDSGKYTSKRAGHSICLSSPTAHWVFAATWGEYGPSGSYANLLPDCVFQSDTGYFKRNTGSFHSNSDGGLSEPFSGRPNQNNGLVDGKSMIIFPAFAKSFYDYKMPSFVTTTKVNGWQTSHLHNFMFYSNHDPSGKDWEENFNDYKTHESPSMGPAVLCIRGNAEAYGSTPHDRISDTNNSSIYWVPWGLGTHLDPRDLWGGSLSFTGREPTGYLGFQNSSSATRITKRVNGVCPGVTYRLYFSAAYRPAYWGSGFRTYILEPHVGVSAPEEGDTEHKISRQLIAYGEYTHDANRWINYNAKRNVQSALGRPWQEGDGYGFTCNMRRANPYELNAAKTPDGDGGQDDVLRNDKFKVFYIEFTPKKGSHVIEIIFETAYRVKSYGSTNYAKPNHWVDIPPNIFFDATYQGSNDFAPHVRNWDHQFRGPWVHNPNPAPEGGGASIYSETSRDNTWFLDEVWMTTTRPCWVEPVKFKYNVPQGGYVLSIDQGDKSNRPVDDVFLSNSPSEVIKLSGQFPDADSGGGIVGTIDSNNGYFKDGVEYEIDLVRQHTHVQNWDPFAVDGDNKAAKYKRTNQSLLMPWMPGDYFGGLVFCPPNPGLYYLTNPNAANNSKRLGLHDVAGGINPDNHYRAFMPTTYATYNTLWTYIGDDPNWGSNPIGWNGIMNTVTGNNTTPGSVLMRHPYLPSITPSSLTSGTGNLEIDPRAGELHLYTSYPHTLMADDLGVYVELPIIGLVAFFNKDHLSNYTGKEASVDLTTAELFEGTFHSNELFLKSGQHAAIRGDGWTGSYSDWVNNLPASRQHIFKDGKLWLSLENNATTSGQLGKEIADEQSWSYVNIFTSTALWPWFRDEGTGAWGMFELNRHGEIGNTPKILWWDQGFSAIHWKEWMIGAGQNMSPVTRGSAYDKYLKLSYDQLKHWDNDLSGGYRTNGNWVGDYIVVNHGSLVNLWLARPIASELNSQNPAGPRLTARPVPSDDERDDTSPYVTFNGISFTKESTHNNHKFRFL